MLMAIALTIVLGIMTQLGSAEVHVNLIQMAMVFVMTMAVILVLVLRMSAVIVVVQVLPLGSVTATEMN
jgi:hypothetical protein